MINITDITFGWATLHLGYCSFDVSYLSDLKYELDKLFDLDTFHDDTTVKRVVLEGEGQGDLGLIAYLTFDDLRYYLKIDEYKELDEKSRCGYILNIIWQREYSSDGNSISILKFPYDKFMDEYKTLMNNIKETYIRDFICPYSPEEYQEYYDYYDGGDDK